MTCKHKIWDQDTAVADGMCPICMAAEIEQLRGALSMAQMEADRLGRMVEKMPPLKEIASKIGQLETALKYYGDHTYECSQKNGTDCDCGYEDVIK